MPNFRRVDIGDSTLYLGNCFDVLSEVGPVHAVITDPPYGITTGIVSDRPTKWQRRAGAKTERWDDQATENLSDLLDIGEHQVVWGGNYYPLPPSRCWLSWFKPDAPPSMAQFELAWTNMDRNARQISCSISATNAERVGHPTQKPLPVMLWTINLVKPESVFDPFMGSGTTGVACAKMGKRFVGCEINERYFDMACRRIEHAYRQADLFVACAPISKPIQTSLI